MKNPNEFNKYVIMLALIFAASALLVSKTSASVTLIANPEITDSSLSASDIESIFLGKKKSLPSGKKIKVVTLKSGSTHDEFLNTYVNKTSSQFSAYWKRKIVDGTGIPPKSFNSESELLAYVKAHGNVVGYVSSDSGGDGIKVLNID